MDANMILIRIDECGDEVEVDRFTVGDELDEDYIELWKETKINKAREQFPEAQRFYFEDRRKWKSEIARALHGDYDPWEGEDCPEDWEEDDTDMYAGSCTCDIAGVCSGPSCLQYYSCQC